MDSLLDIFRTRHIRKLGDSNDSKDESFNEEIEPNGETKTKSLQSSAVINTSMEIAYKDILTPDKNVITWSDGDIKTSTPVESGTSNRTSEEYRSLYKNKIYELLGLKEVIADQEETIEHLTLTNQQKDNKIRELEEKIKNAADFNLEMEYQKELRMKDIMMKTYKEKATSADLKNKEIKLETIKLIQDLENALSSFSFSCTTIDENNDQPKKETLMKMNEKGNNVNAKRKLSPINSQDSKKRCTVNKIEEKKPEIPTRTLAKLRPRCTKYVVDTSSSDTNDETKMASTSLKTVKQKASSKKDEKRGNYMMYGITDELLKKLSIVAQLSYNGFVRQILSFIIGDDYLVYCTSSGIHKKQERPAIPKDIKKTISEIYDGFGFKKKLSNDFNGAANAHILKLRDMAKMSDEITKAEMEVVYGRFKSIEDKKNSILASC